MPTNTSYPRPIGPIEKWSQTQAMRWIQAEVKVGNVVFSRHAERDRGPERGVSHDEAIEAISKGQCINWEPREDPKTRVPCMNMTFRKQLRTRSIVVVTAISDEDPDVVVITVWQDES